MKVLPIVRPIPQNTMFALPHSLYARLLCLAGACWLLLPGSGHAQTAGDEATDSFVGATLVTAEGDSLQGRVEWPSDAPTPETIRFRPESAATTTTYAPLSLRAVRLDDGRRLVSRTVQVDQVPSDPRKAAKFLQSGRDRQLADTLFLEVVVTGPLAMFAKLGSRDHFFVESEGDIAELRNRKQYIASQRAVATRRRYRRQLRSRMKACPKAQADTDHLAFRLQSLKNLIARYNRCVGETDVYERASRPRFSTSFGLVGGAMRSEFALSSVQTGFNSFGWGTGGHLGVSLTTRLLHTNRHWAVRAELGGILQRIGANVGRSGYFLGVSTLSASDFVEMTWAKSTVLMRYYVSNADWSPYAEAGVTFGYLLDIESTLSGMARYVLDQNRFTPGVAVGTGLQYRNVQVGVRAELTSAWASYTNVKSRLLNFSLSMGYQF